MPRTPSLSTVMPTLLAWLACVDPRFVSAQVNWLTARQAGDRLQEAVVVTETSQLFTLIRTVQVTPDAGFDTGSFARVNYLPAKDLLVVTFGSKRSPQAGNCPGAGYGFKEYTLDMEETGQAGFFAWVPSACEANDSGSVMVDNSDYFAWVAPGEDYGWRLSKYDATSWQQLAQIHVALDSSKETNNDPMVAWVNGQLDVSAQYNASGTPPLEEGAATHHRFFSTDLQILGMRILPDTPHICGSSMLYVDGVYYFVTANAFSGDLIVMRYDRDWKFLGTKTLRSQAHWSQGIAFDGQRFYVSYLDTSQRTTPGFLPVHLNVHLAAFDRDWNLVDDVAVTNFVPADNKQPGRPWVTLRNSRLYVSYDVDTVDSSTHEEQKQWQAYVSVFAATATPTHLARKHLGRTGP